MDMCPMMMLGMGGMMMHGMGRDTAGHHTRMRPDTPVRRPRQ